MISAISQSNQSVLSSQWNSILSGQTSGSANNATQSIESLLKEASKTAATHRSENSTKKWQEVSQASTSIQAASAFSSSSTQASPIQALKTLAADETGFILSRQNTQTSMNQLLGLQAYSTKTA